MTFDEEVYRKAKVHFAKAFALMGKSVSDLNEAALVLVQYLKGEHGFTRDGIENMRSYLTRFLDDVMAQRIDPFAQQPWEKTVASAAPPRDEETETRALIDRLIMSTAA